MRFSRSTIFAVLASASFLLGSLAPSAPSEAGVPAGSVTITLCQDGNAYSIKADGDCNPPPAYEALQFNIADNLATAGFANIACGTTGTDFSHDIRQYASGTHAATANITVATVSGDDFAASGGAAPGTGDNVTFECDDPALDYSGGVRFTIDDSNVCTPPNCSSDVSSTKPYAAFGQDDPPPASDRDIWVETDFETGQFQAVGFQSNGVFKDNGNIHQLIPRATFTITNITNHATAPVMTWSGADPVFTNPDSGTNGGFTITGVSGMTGIEGRMYRCTSINTAANTCTLRQDGVGTNQTSDGNSTLGDNNVNTTSFGTFSGTATATLWTKVQEQNGCCGSGSGRDIRVVSSITPPTNDVGAAATFYPPTGSTRFLSTAIYRTRDYSAQGGNSDKNKPRWTNLLNDQDLHFDYDVEICQSFMVGLPSNYDHNDRGGMHQTEIQLLTNGEQGGGGAPADSAAPIEFGIIGSASGVDQWAVQLDLGTAGNTQDITLLPVTAAIGRWAIWTFRYRWHNGVRGMFKAWVAYADADADGGGITADTLVYSRTGQPTGYGYGTGNAGRFAVQMRAYKYGWAHNADTTPSKVIWMGRDEWRVVRPATDGGTCEDVHPYRANLN